MNVPEILTEAAKVIEKRGWWQGDFIPSGVDQATCPVCVMAAINVATGHQPDDQVEDDHDPRAVAVLALADHLGLAEKIELYDSVGAALGGYWNDTVAESGEQVITELRELAAELTAGAS